MSVQSLYHVNGGNPDEAMEVRCANCKAVLGDERAVASSPSGAKFFCKAEPGDVTNSCYLSWRRRHH